MNAVCGFADSDVPDPTALSDFHTVVRILQRYVNSGTRCEIEGKGIGFITRKAIRLAEDQKDPKSAVSVVNLVVSQCPAGSIPAWVAEALGCALMKAGQVAEALVHFHSAASLYERATVERRLKLYLHLCDAYARIGKPRQVVRYGTQAVQLVDQSTRPLTSTMREDLYQLYDLLTQSEQALNRFQRAKYWLKQSLRHMSARRLPCSTPSSPTYERTGGETCPAHLLRDPTVKGFSSAIRSLFLLKEKAAGNPRNSVLFQCWRRLSSNNRVKVTITEDRHENWIVTMTDSNEQLMQRKIVGKTDAWRKLQPCVIASMVRQDSKGDLVLCQVRKDAQIREINRENCTGSAGKPVNPLRNGISDRNASSGRAIRTQSPLLIELSQKLGYIVTQSKRVPLLNVPKSRLRRVSAASRKRYTAGRLSPQSQSPRVLPERSEIGTTRGGFTIRISEATGDMQSPDINTSNEDSIKATTDRQSL